MKNKKYIYLSIAVFVLLIIVSGGGIMYKKSTTALGSNIEEVYPEDMLNLHLSSSNLDSLSKEEIDDLMYMREEEKLAKDVYEEMYDTWGQKIFWNISQSEETHTNSVKSLLELYGIEDPVKSSERGIFSNKEFEKLYNDLATQGRSSLNDAYTVGALIEELDIYDLEIRINKTNVENIILVYNNLQRGSRNHLRSFTSMLSKNGEEYEPKYISQDEYASIISSPKETGNGSSGGRGKNKMYK